MARPYRKGGAVAEEGGKKKRGFRESEEAPPPVARAKGGRAPVALTRRPKGPKVSIAIKGKPKVVSTPSPYDYEVDEGTAPPQGTPSPAATPPPPPPANLAKGGSCEEGKMAKGGKIEKKARPAEKLKSLKKAGGGTVKLAAGGVAKVRKGFPNTEKKPEKFAHGGLKRGTGAARRGLRFSGIY